MDNNLLQRLDLALKKRVPTFYKQLQPGLSESRIVSLEESLGISLPEDMRALYRWRNGQRDHTQYLDIWSGIWLSTESILEEWETQKTLLEDPLDYLPGPFQNNQDGNWWNLQWIPFIKQYMGSDLICLDLAGSFDGIPGQIIRFLGNEAAREVWFPDLSTWIMLSVIVLELDDLWEGEEYLPVGPPFAISEHINPGYPWFFDITGKITRES